MKSSIGEQERVVLEAYLQDLIWGVNNPNELDVPVETLTTLQHWKTRSAGKQASRIEDERKGGTMESTFEIFKKRADQSSVWIGVVKGRERAKEALISLKLTSPGTYFACDQHAGKIVQISNPRTWRS